MHTSTYLRSVLQNGLDSDNDFYESWIKWQIIKSCEIYLHIPLFSWFTITTGSYLLSQHHSPARSSWGEIFLIHPFTIVIPIKTPTKTQKNKNRGKVKLRDLKIKISTSLSTLFCFPHPNTRTDLKMNLKIKINKYSPIGFTSKIYKKFYLVKFLNNKTMKWKTFSLMRLSRYWDNVMKNLFINETLSLMIL